MSVRVELAPFVSFRAHHAYYRSGVFEDLALSPTPDTAALLERRQMRFLQEKGGFSLFCLIETSASGPPRPRSWIEPGTRLVFSAAPQSALVSFVTDPPPAQSPGTTYLLRNRPAVSGTSAATNVGPQDALRLSPLLLRCSFAAATSAGVLCVCDDAGSTLMSQRLDLAQTQATFDLSRKFTGGVVKVLAGDSVLERCFVDDAIFTASPFFALELSSGAESWPSPEDTLSSSKPASRVFTAHFGTRSALWCYHIVTQTSGPLASSDLDLVAGPLLAPYPNAVSFQRFDDPDVAGRFPDSVVTSYRSSVPLPFFERAAKGIALWRTQPSRSILIEHLPNARGDNARIQSGQLMSDIYVRV